MGPVSSGFHLIRSFGLARLTITVLAESLKREIALGARPPTGRVASFRATGSTTSSIEWALGSIRAGYRRLAADAEAALYMRSMEEPARSVAAVIDDIEPTPCHRTLTKDAILGFDWRDRGRLLCNAIRQLVKQQCAPYARRSAS